MSFLLRAFLHAIEYRRSSSPFLLQGMNIDMHEARLQRIMYVYVYIYIYISSVHKNILLYTTAWLHECIRILQVHCHKVIALYFTVKFQNFHLSLSWGKFKIYIYIFFFPLQGNKIKSYVTLCHVFTGVASCMFTAISIFYSTSFYDSKF